MEEPKLKYKIFATREQVCFNPVIGENRGYVTKTCFKEVVEKPTIKDAVVWRDKNQKFESQYLIVPCY